MRMDMEFYDYISGITESPLLNGLIILIVILNSVFNILETNYQWKYNYFPFFEIAD